MRAHSDMLRLPAAVAGCALLVALAAAIALALSCISSTADQRGNVLGQVNARHLRGAVVADAAAAVASLDVQAIRDAAYEPGAVLVAFPESASAAEVSASLAGATTVSPKVIASSDVSRGAAKLSLAEGCSLADALAELSGLAGIASVQPNFIYRLADGAPDASDAAAGMPAPALANGSSPGLAADGETGASGDADPGEPAAAKVNDPRAASQWHLNGETGIHAFEAWSLVTGGQADPAVAVAVMDTGCKTDHPDLRANIVETYDASGSGVADINGHGTHVCGIASAVTNNGEGVAGVSHNAGLVSVQVFKKTAQLGLYTDTECLLDAYRYVTRNAERLNVKAVNLSIGGKLGPDELEETDVALVTAIEDAYDAGILTVCAAGNGASSGAYTCYPCDYLEHGLGVIALDKSQGRASYSNYNVDADQTTKSIAAPGGTGGAGSGILSTYSSSTMPYKETYGTSMASPVVAGVVALVFAANPQLAPQQAMDILHGTATDLGPEGFDQVTGYGEVNAYAAVVRALEARVADEGADEATGGEGGADAGDVGDFPQTPAAGAEPQQDAGGELGVTPPEGNRDDDRVPQPETQGNGAASAPVPGSSLADIPAAIPATAPLPADNPSLAGTAIPGGAAVLAGGQDRGTATAGGASALTDAISAAAGTAPASSGSQKAKLAKQHIAVKSQKATVSAFLVKYWSLPAFCIQRVDGAKTSLTFKKVSGSKRLVVNRQTGVVTVKRGTKGGTYKMKVRVFAQKGGVYKKSNIVTKTLKVKVS